MMWVAIAKNWITTIMGLIPTLIVILTCIHEKRLPTEVEWAAMTGIAGVGLFAKDANKTGV